jgi:hypothetical protein
MAAPLKIIRRLDAVATDYAVFERDQVLNEQQLNSVTEYLDDQSRLTRTQLLGIGIVGGLWPSATQEALTLGRGLGVTSDGDLLVWPTDTEYRRWIEYDASAPAYEPFHAGEARLPLIELLDAVDPRAGRPLADLANRLPGLVAIAFMESYENDPDLCTGGDCDNKGRTAKNTRRLLLADRELAEKLRLTAGVLTGAAIARRLPRLRAVRPDLGTGLDAKVDVTSAERFALRYRSAAEATFKSLREAVATLTRLLAGPDIAGLPDTRDWDGWLVRRIEALPSSVAGIQYLHAHAKDLVGLWNELRAALFADDSVLVPSPLAFPKHLLLGALADPNLDRTGCYPSPWLNGSNADRQRVAMLMRQFGLLLERFALPSAPLPKITPSRQENVPLAARAVPAYYQADARLRATWAGSRALPGDDEAVPGYHWQPDPVPVNAADPFLGDLGDHDFFRIEGHLGMKADAAEKAIEKLVRQRNLPIAVMSALAHSDRRLLVPPLKFKQSSLHSLHYLWRQDVASHLKDNIAYSDMLVKRFDADRAWVPATTGKPSATETVAAAKEQLLKADGELTGAGKPLAARSFKQFQGVAKDWSAPLSAAVVHTAKARTAIGDIVRTDVASPVDTLHTSNTHIWVDWLGELLQHREERQKEKLLLTNLLDEHPGLAHAGGVVPGGTFVLVYNDAGLVIGDLMLPYWIDDNDESDFEEPQLTLPDIKLRLPSDLLPIKVIKPLKLDLDDFKKAEITPNLQLLTDYGAFYKESLSSVLSHQKLIEAKVDLTGSKAATKDAYLQTLLDRTARQRSELQTMKDIAADDKQPQVVRERAAADARQVELTLADTVSETVRYFAVDAPESVRFEADKAAVYDTVGLAITVVGSQEASGKLQKNLQVTSEAASKLAGGSSAVVANQILVNAGFKLR